MTTKRLMIVQRKGESADFTAMRAFAAAIPLMTKRDAEAAAHWIIEKALDRKTKFKPT